MGEGRRVAIVTGAARGIGAEVARRFASDGMAVAVLDIDEPSCADTVFSIEAAGGSAIAVGADVADEEAVAAAVDTVAGTLGPPTVLVNNAGIIRDHLLHKMQVNEWDLVVAVHLRGSFLMARTTVPYMMKAGFGRIINLSSTSALGNRGQANYAAAKAGVQGLTKTLAIELGPSGITANAIAPGFIETDMTAATAERLRMTFEEFSELVVAQIPVGRAGKPADIAHAASYLASDGAGFVSGQTLYVAGGPTG